MYLSIFKSNNRTISTGNAFPSSLISYLEYWEYLFIVLYTSKCIPPENDILWSQNELVKTQTIAPLNLIIIFAK